MRMNAIELCDSTSTLSVLPEIYERVVLLLDNPHATREEILQLIEHDPTLTARLLAVANRVPDRFDTGRQFERVGDAVEIIDLDQIRQIVAAGSAIEVLRSVGQELVDMQDFWHHSVCSALAGRFLANCCDGLDGELMYVTCLLHDIGQLVIYEAQPELSRQILLRAGESHRYEAEKALLETTHAEVGAELVKRLGLSVRTGEVVQYHHEPGLAVRYPRETSIAHIATAISNCIEPSWKMNGAGYDPLDCIHPFAWEATGLTPDVIGPTLDEINMRSFEVLGIVQPEAFTVF